MCNRRPRWKDMVKSISQNQTINQSQAIAGRRGRSRLNTDKLQSPCRKSDGWDPMEPHRSWSRWNTVKSSLQSGLSSETDIWDTVEPLQGQRRWNTVKSSSSERPRLGECKGYYYLTFFWTELKNKHSRAFMIVCTGFSL